MRSFPLKKRDTFVSRRNEKFGIEEEYSCGQEVRSFRLKSNCFCGQEVRSFRLKRSTFVSGFVRVRRKRTRCSCIVACTDRSSANEYEIASLVFVNWKVTGGKEEG